MSLPEVVSVRLDEIKQKKTDIVSPYLTYIGRADFTRQTNEPYWQILRKTIDGSIESIDYANKGSYTCIWDDRSSYFSSFTDPLAFSTAVLPVITANQEYSFTTAAGTRRIWLKSRQDGLIRVGEISGFTDDYWTLFPGQPFDAPIDRVITFYFSSPLPNQTLEILSWN